MTCPRRGGASARAPFFPEARYRGPGRTWIPSRRYGCPMERDAAVEAVFMPVRPASTFEETVERLGSAIRLGLLAPGDKLPPERELAGRLRISGSTLRQALTALGPSGHLGSQPGRGRGPLRAPG